MKERINITLEKKLLDDLDKYCSDKNKNYSGKSRSQIISELINKHLHEVESRVLK